MKKLFSITGVILGAAVGATAAYYLAPEDGETYQKEVKKWTLELKQKAAETGIQVLDELIELLEECPFSSEEQIETSEQEFVIIEKTN